MVSAWGYFLIQGVRDPLGGINSLWPLFGIANQMLAAIALCLATTVILKMQLARSRAESPIAGPGLPGSPGRPALALICLVPLAWLLAATMTAGVEKITDSDPRIGFLAQARGLNEARPVLEQAVAAAKLAGNASTLRFAEEALRTNRVLHFNNLLDAAVAGGLLALTAAVVLMSLAHWWLLLNHRRAAVLSETEPVWLPATEAGRSGGLRLATVVPVAVALLKELSSEGSLERARQAAAVCSCEPVPSKEQAGVCVSKTQTEIYLEVTERRFNGVTRCC